MSITLNGRFYTKAELRQWQPTLVDDGISENVRHALSFCQQWLSGQQEFVVNTSGSTGTPKPITLLRKQMEVSARLTGSTLGLRAGQRALICLPTRYIAGRMMLVRSFVLGLDATVVEPASDPLASFSDTVHFDFTALIPLQLQTLLAGASAREVILNRMKAILIGGGPISAALQQRLQVITAPIFHTYGMTETVTHIALRRLNGPNATDAFFPLKGVLLDVDARGCLTIQSPVTRGEVLYTNDRVTLRNDGSFVWLGRLDNVINSGGIKVQVERVEAALEQVLLTLFDHQGKAPRFFVGSTPDERLGEIVTAIFEGRRPESTMIEQMRTQLADHLHAYEVPRRFYTVKRFVETPTGKIDRPATLRLLHDSLTAR